jgi:hypothetical protein
LKALRFEKIAADPARLLRNGDAPQRQSVPRRNADLAQAQRCPEALAEFLLDTPMGALRLNVEIETDEKNAAQEQDTSKEPEQKAAEPFHPLKLSSAWLKKR